MSEDRKKALQYAIMDVADPNPVAQLDPDIVPSANKESVLYKAGLKMPKPPKQPLPIQTQMAQTAGKLADTQSKNLKNTMGVKMDKQEMMSPEAAAEAIMGEAKVNDVMPKVADQDRDKVFEILRAKDVKKAEMCKSWCEGSMKKSEYTPQEVAMIILKKAEDMTKAKLMEWKDKENAPTEEMKELSAEKETENINMEKKEKSPVKSFLKKYEMKKSEKKDK